MANRLSTITRRLIYAAIAVLLAASIAEVSGVLSRGTSASGDKGIVLPVGIACPYCKAWNSVEPEYYTFICKKCGGFAFVPP